ncbi:CvpA family protein [Guyparkeria halophila]|uniref:CvpA family protein n=1 Tax=Guyparkeria halophila TaxID=47960 RepID=A0ABZ0YT24_9GAMM|nr:CvpA family protein [Guyparkeria halophila]WQH15316.1 CvpA family protein [Guyparkeria halophila]
MTMVDWILLAIVLISTAIALVRGFVKEVISLVTWLAAFGIALAFSQTAAVLVPEAVDIPSARVAIAFVALFVVVLILGGIINWAISKLVETTGLSGTDRSVGMVFGLLRGVLIVAGLLLLGGFTALPQEAWWQASTLIPHFQVVAEWLLAVMPADVAANVQW